MLALFKELVMEDYSNETKQSEYFTESREVTTDRFSCFIGVDLHKTTVTLRAVDPSEEIISSLRTHTQCVNKIETWINELPEPKWMAVEAVSFTEWFIDRYRDCVDRIDIADATELARRRGKRRKTDRNDALDVAVRLVRGNCPLGYIADESLMYLCLNSNVYVSYEVLYNAIMGVLVRCCVVCCPRSIRFHY